MNLTSLLSWELVVTISSVVGAGAVFVKDYFAIRKLQLENKALAEKLNAQPRIVEPTIEEVRQFGTTEYSSPRRLPFLGTILLIVAGGFGTGAFTKAKQAVANERASVRTLETRNELLSARSEVLGLRGVYESASEESLGELGLEERAQAATTRLSLIEDRDLSPLEQISKYESILLAQLLSSKAANQSSRQMTYSREAVQSASKLRTVIEAVRASPDISDDARRWLESEQIDARASYLSAVALATNARLGGAASIDDANEELRRIAELAPDYLSKYPPERNPDLSWLRERGEIN